METESITNIKKEIVQILTLLEEIGGVSQDILKKLEPVMKNIKDVNGDIVTQSAKKYPQHPTVVLQEIMQSITVEWISDATTAKVEVDKFIKVTPEGFLFQMDSTPFLTEVWNGDAYDKSGVEGLKELKADLSKQFSNINRENLFALTIKKLNETK